MKKLKLNNATKTPGRKDSQSYKQHFILRVPSRLRAFVAARGVRKINKIPIRMKEPTTQLAVQVEVRLTHF
jgi:hypothetical protein